MTVIELEINKPVWGATSGDVLREANVEVFNLNTPAPFETIPDRPDMAHLCSRMMLACANATQARRKGMMISSRFRVDNPDRNTVRVYHVHNESPDELFLTFKICNT